MQVLSLLKKWFELGGKPAHSSHRARYSSVRHRRRPGERRVSVALRVDVLVARYQELGIVAVISDGVTIRHDTIKRRRSSTRFIRRQARSW
jgi:hypothetical protein